MVHDDSHGYQYIAFAVRSAVIACAGVSGIGQLVFRFIVAEIVHRFEKLPPLREQDRQRTGRKAKEQPFACLLYTSDAADE